MREHARRAAIDAVLTAVDVQSGWFLESFDSYAKYFVPESSAKTATYVYMLDDISAQTLAVDTIDDLSPDVVSEAALREVARYVRVDAQDGRDADAGATAPLIVSEDDWRTRGKPRRILQCDILPRVLPNHGTLQIRAAETDLAIGCVTLSYSEWQKQGEAIINEKYAAQHELIREALADDLEYLRKRLLDILEIPTGARRRRRRTKRK